MNKSQTNIIPKKTIKVIEFHSTVQFIDYLDAHPDETFNARFFWKNIFNKKCLKFEGKDKFEVYNDMSQMFILNLCSNFMDLFHFSVTDLRPTKYPFLSCPKWKMTELNSKVSIATQTQNGIVAVDALVMLGSCFIMNMVKSKLPQYVYPSKSDEVKQSSTNDSSSSSSSSSSIQSFRIDETVRSKSSSESKSEENSSETSSSFSIDIESPKETHIGNDMSQLSKLSSFFASKLILNEVEYMGIQVFNLNFPTRIELPKLVMGRIDLLPKSMKVTEIDTFSFSSFMTSWAGPGKFEWDSGDAVSTLKRIKGGIPITVAEFMTIGYVNNFRVKSFKNSDVIQVQFDVRSCRVNDQFERVNVLGVWLSRYPHTTLDLLEEMKCQLLYNCNGVRIELASIRDLNSLYKDLKFLGFKLYKIIN